MSVQISGSTLFNVLQVTQEFFSLTSEEPLKGTVSSQEMKVSQGKRGVLGSSDSPHVASLGQSFTDFLRPITCTASSV